MDEQQIENLADILVVSVLDEREFGGNETLVLMHFRPAVVWAFGEETWTLVEEKTREFLMEHDAKDEIDNAR